MLQDLPDSGTKLPLTETELKAAIKSCDENILASKWADKVRIVATLRCGSMSPQLMREWEQNWKPKKQADDDEVEDLTQTERERCSRQSMDGCLFRPTK